jgi:hypothetical protein
MHTSCFQAGESRGSLPTFVLRDRIQLVPKTVTDAVLDALDYNETRSGPILDSDETGRQFALVILQLLAGRGRLSGSPVSESRSRESN